MVADGLRLVNAFMAGFSVALSAWTLVIYFRRVGWTWDLKAAVLRKHVHIVNVALVYFLLTIGAVIELLARVGTDPTWRGPFYFVAFLVGNVAQWNLLRFEQRASRNVRVA